MRDEETNKSFSDNRLEQRKVIAKSIFDYLPKSSQDWIIIVSIVGLLLIWIADIFIMDPLPFVDEILLPLLTYLVAQWYANRKAKDSSTN